MRNLVFVIWMLGWPVVRVVEQLGDFHIGLTFSDNVRGLAAITSMAIWVAVGYKLYEQPPEPKTSTALNTVIENRDAKEIL